MAIDDYEIEKKPIGSGAFGFVKKGKRKEDGREVAIKYLKNETTETLNNYLQEVITFLNEKIKLLYKLTHENIVETFDTFSFEDEFSGITYLCIVMEFCESKFSNKDIKSEEVIKKRIITGVEKTNERIL
jgi:serine/threonine protein kinase